MTRSKKGPRISVSLPENDHAALAALADKHDVSVSWIARKAITEFLKGGAANDVQLPFNL